MRVTSRGLAGEQPVQLQREREIAADGQLAVEERADAAARARDDLVEDVERCPHRGGRVGRSAPPRCRPPALDLDRPVRHPAGGEHDAGRGVREQRRVQPVQPFLEQRQQIGRRHPFILPVREDSRPPTRSPPPAARPRAAPPRTPRGRRGCRTAASTAAGRSTAATLIEQDDHLEPAGRVHDLVHLERDEQRRSDDGDVLAPPLERPQPDALGELQRAVQEQSRPRSGSASRTWRAGSSRSS